MKKILMFTVLCSFQMSFSQVTMENNKLVRDGQKYKISQYKEVFKNPEAAAYFQKARTNSTVGNIFAGIGGGAMGFGLARALSGNKTTVITPYGTQTVKQDVSGAWAAVGIGAGIVGVGIPFALAANKNAKKAMAVENGEATAFQPYFKLESAGNGLALSYNF
ncbi:MAG: hypothetical protein K0M63_02470 [Weeksellaceae bacterium]|nr:hypothetical protein [Weeksellaceae bacterium]